MFLDFFKGRFASVAQGFLLLMVLIFHLLGCFPRIFYMFFVC